MNGAVKTSDKSDERPISIFTWMSGTGRRLIRWEKNGLISRDQLFDIVDFEKENNGKRLMRSFAGIALFAIAVGILSIIAANWMHIPGEIKIIAHMALNIFAAFSIYKYDRAGNTVFREGATFLFFALNLTMIVLIGQVYQLNGNVTAALGTWMVISTPAVMRYGRSPVNALTWVIAALTTEFFILTDIAESLRGDDFPVFIMCLAAGLYTPLMLMAAGASTYVRENRPHWAHTIYSFAMTIFAVQATTGSFMWYGDVHRELGDVLIINGSYLQGYGIMAAVIIAAIFAVYCFEWLKDKKGEKIIDRSGIIFVIGSLIAATLPLFTMAGEMNLMAALHFTAYWIFAGWVGYRMGFTQLMNAAFTMVTLRIIIVYLELFGSMMTTGFSLIFSGILMLVFLKYAMHIREKLIASKKEG